MPANNANANAQTHAHQPPAPDVEHPSIDRSGPFRRGRRMHDADAPERFCVLRSDGAFWQLDGGFGPYTDAALLTRDDANEIAAANDAGVVEPGRSAKLAPLFYLDK